MLLAVTVVTCTAKLLLGLHQDLHYVVFPWPLFFFPPSRDQLSQLVRCMEGDEESSRVKQCKDRLFYYIVNRKQKLWIFLWGES